MVQPSADEPSATTADQRAWIQLTVLAALIVAWFVLIQRFGEGDVYSVLGPFACTVCAVSVVIDPRAMLRWLGPHGRSMLVGAGVGIAMVCLTYPVFRIAVAIDP